MRKDAKDQSLPLYVAEALASIAHAKPSIQSCVSQSNSFEYEEPTSIVDAERIDLSIYPNPFRDEATVDFGREVDGATISVVDVFGKQLEQYILTNTDKHILKRNNKASGVYFVEIEVEGVKLFSKIIIE